MSVWVDSILRWVDLMGVPIRLCLCYERTYVRTNERSTYVPINPQGSVRARGAHKMSPKDASRIVELAATIWPNVKDDQRTREAWFLALAKTNLYDALDAVGSLARDRKTVHVSDVVKRAASIRESLLRSLPPVPDPPVELADDPAAEILWMRTARERQLHTARMARQAVPA
jgi:hypothetical protein